MTIQLAKRRNLFLLFAVAMAVVATALVYTGVASGDDDDNGNGNRYEVSITNITKGQIISPAVVATHRSSLDPIFMLGSPASDELAQVAEDAVLGPLVAKLEADSAVGAVEVLFGAGGPMTPIMPGATTSFVIDAGKRDRELSLVAMLVTTNDTFMGLNAIALPRRAGYYLSPGYDSGTEVNNEDCDYIPGPPCGNPGMRAGGGEGYVYIGNGVHGITPDLDPALHDWNNPVAKISVRRINGGDDD